jgi:hypothetical protein
MDLRGSGQDRIMLGRRGRERHDRILNNRRNGWRRYRATLFWLFVCKFVIRIAVFIGFGYDDYPGGIWR